MSRELHAVAHVLAGKMMIAEVVVGLAACLPAGLFFFFLLFVVFCLLVACFLFAVCCL